MIELLGEGLNVRPSCLFLAPLVPSLPEIIRNPNQIDRMGCDGVWTRAVRLMQSRTDLVQICKKISSMDGEGGQERSLP